MRRALTTVAAALAASTALSQEAALLEAFSGQWYSFEPRMGAAAQQTCALILSTQPSPQGGLQAAAQNCAPPLDQVALWGIIDGKIRLVGAGGQIAALGGHQQRMSGEMGPAAAPIVLERAQGDANAQALSKAIGTYRCLFAGYSNTCAGADQVQMAEAPTQIVTLVDLNMRDQPRADAPVQKVLPRQTIAPVDTCLLTADGPWCRALFEGESAWVARNALRQDTWPVLTYTFVQ